MVPEPLSMSLVDARCHVPNSLCAHQLPPVEPIAKMAATLGILLPPNCSKPQLPPHLLGQSRPVSSSCKQQQFGSESTIGNGQSILSPYSERIAQMKCAKQLCLATFRSECRQKIVSSADSRDTHEVKNFAAALTPLQFSTSNIRNSLCTYSILESNMFFQVCISIEYFQFINKDQWVLPNNQSNTPLCLIPTAGFLFSRKGLNRGFYIPVHVTSTSGGVKCSCTERSCTSTYRGI